MVPRKKTCSRGLQGFLTLLTCCPSMSLLAANRCNLVPKPFNSKIGTMISMTALDDASIPSTDYIRPTLVTHHTAIWVSNITRSMAFYSMFGFEEERRFKAGPARAVWLRVQHRKSSRGHAVEETSRVFSLEHYLELIEVPQYLEAITIPSVADTSSETKPKIGMNHFALDVSVDCTRLEGLPQFLRHLNKFSENKFDRSVRLVVAPHERIIGQDVYEVAFVADPDGVLIELLCSTTRPIPQKLEPSW